jgi:hypothetical protein
LPSVNAVPGVGRLDNGKPVARRGRKATGLKQVAGLPNRRWTVQVQRSTPVRVAVRAVLNLGLVAAVVLAAAANFHG